MNAVQMELFIVERTTHTWNKCMLYSTIDPRAAAMKCYAGSAYVLYKRNPRKHTFWIMQMVRLPLGNVRYRLVKVNENECIPQRVSTPFIDSDHDNLNTSSTCHPLRRLHLSGWGKSFFLPELPSVLRFYGQC